MKKYIITLLAAALFLLCGCNRAIVDTVYKYDHAMLTLPNGDVVEGKVQSWRDYEDGDQIQVKIDDQVYLVHSSDIVLIAD